MRFKGKACEIAGEKEVLGQRIAWIRIMEDGSFREVPYDELEKPSTEFSMSYIRFVSIAAKIKDEVARRNILDAFKHYGKVKPKEDPIKVKINMWFEILTMSRKKIQVLLYVVYINVLFCGSVVSQISAEINFVGGKPLGIFGSNINRDAYFGYNFGIFYKLQKPGNLSFGLQFCSLPYDESTLSSLQIEDELFIRQRFKSNVGMQVLNGVIRANLKKQYKNVNPYFDGIIGLNRFYGITRSEDAFFQGDTNNDGKISDIDGEINPEDFGIITSIKVANSATKYDLNSISSTIGLGFGLQIKIIKNLKFDNRIAYMHGFETTYYDYGSQEMIINSIENFLIVKSATPVFFWTMGINYTFEK